MQIILGNTYTDQEHTKRFERNDKEQNKNSFLKCEFIAQSETTILILASFGLTCTQIQFNSQTTSTNNQNVNEKRKFYAFAH